MKRFVRWLIGVLFVLTIILYLVLLALPYLLNPNDYKSLITELVREQTGRELSIAGDLQLQISPRLHVSCSLGKVRLANHALLPPTSTFAQSEQIKMKLSLWPLLFQRRLHMAFIILDGATVNLVRTKEGLNNWEPLVATPGLIDGETTADDQGLRQLLVKKLLSGVAGLDLGKIDLTQINVRYHDQQTGRLIVLQELKLKTGQLREKRQFPFEAAFNLSQDNRASHPLTMPSGHMVMQGNATLFLAAPRLLIEDLRIKGNLKGQSLPKKGLKVQVAGNTDIELRPPKMTIKDFSLSHEDLSLQGHGIIEGFSAPRFSMSLTVPPGSPQALLKQLATKLPILQEGAAVSQISAELEVTGNQEMIEISEIKIKADDITMTGAVTIKDRVNPAYEARLQINHLNIDPFLAPYRRQPTDPLPQTSEQQLLVPAAEQPEIFPAVIPSKLLQKLRLQLDLSADACTIGGAKLARMQLQLKSQDGILHLETMTAQLYDGAMTLKGSVDVTGEVPRIELHNTINKMQLADFLLDTGGWQDLTGTARIKTDITSSGVSMEDLSSQLNGTIEFEIVNGEIKPVHILQVIRTTADLATEPTTWSGPAATTLEGTGFSHLKGTGIIEDGVLYNNDLMAASEVMQVAGAGEIDLARGLLDLMLQVTLSPALLEDGLGWRDLAGIPIPYTITGPFSEPIEKADLTAVLNHKREKLLLPNWPAPAHQQSKSDDNASGRYDRIANGD